jgi:AAHS family 4-hydroxybenzoate transporter-like MFS transporter
VATTEATPRVVDIQALIDAAPVSSLQKRLLFLCFLVIAIDGFDTAIIGFIAPKGLAALL